MKTVLLLSWLLMGGAGYYAYNFYQQSLTDAAKSAQTLEAANASNTDLTAKVTALGQQVTALQNRLAEQKVTAETPTAVVATAPEPKAAVLPDTITTIYGKTYTGCVLSRVTPDGISFTHAMGVAKVPFTDLDPTFAAKFGYDAASAKKYEQDEAAHDAQSDAMRSVAEDAQKPAAPDVASAPSPSDATARAAKQAQIADLQSRISSLQSQAQSIDAQDAAEFNSPNNIYYNSQGQVEHHRTMGHSEQGVQDRNQAADLQQQLATLQATP